MKRRHVLLASAALPTVALTPAARVYWSRAMGRFVVPADVQGAVSFDHSDGSITVTHHAGEKYGDWSPVAPYRMWPA